MNTSTNMTRRSFSKAAAGVAAAGAAVAAGLSLSGMLAGCDSLNNGSDASKSPAGEGNIGGNLTIYSPNSETLVGNIIPAFEQATGITVDLIQAGTGEVFKKIESEAKNPIADVVWGGSYTVYMSHTDYFEPYTSKNNDGVEQLYRSRGTYTPYCLDGSIILLNNQLTKGLDIKGYADLINEELRGKIISADPATSSSAFSQLTNMLLDMGGYDSDQAWEYVDQVFGLIEGKIAGSSSNVYKTVADGENSVGLSYEDPSQKLVQDGADVTVVYPKEGTVFLPASSAIIKGAANMDQAKAWIDFIVSQEAQEILATKTTVRPVRSDVSLSESMPKLSDIAVKEEDYEYVYENKDQIISRYSEIAKKNAR